MWDGSAWSALTTGGGGGGGSGSFTTLAINGATADTTNRLTLRSRRDAAQPRRRRAPAEDQQGVGRRYGEPALPDAASPGRAELGLAGDDDFHFKVSADGATWKEAIVIDRATGGVTFPFTTSGGQRNCLDRQPHLLRAQQTDRTRNDGRAHVGRRVPHAADGITQRRACICDFHAASRTCTVGTHDGCLSRALRRMADARACEVDVRLRSPGARDFQPLPFKATRRHLCGGLHLQRQRPMALVGSARNTTMAAVIIGACTSATDAMPRGARSSSR